MDAVCGAVRGRRSPARGGAPEIHVVGPGSVGLALAARLARGGARVRVVGRDPRALGILARDGIQWTDPAGPGSWRVPLAEAVPLSTLATAPERSPAAGAAPPILLLCTRLSALDRLCPALARQCPGAAVVCAQNGVDPERSALPYFGRVAGLVLRQTCTRAGPNGVRATGAGRAILGAAPGARDRAGSRAVVDAVARALAAGGVDVSTSEDLAADRWLKLCVNLMSAPNALVRRQDHRTRAFVELKARLLEEARDALAAAGIEARSCDGRDRSLPEEIRAQREALAAGASARDLPLYNSVWTALCRGEDPEVGAFHGRIAELAAAHGLSAPLQARVREALRRARDEGTGPECLSAVELLGEAPEPG